MSFETAAQQAIFTRLSGQIGCNVYDEVPALPSGMPADAFPYVVIGDDTAQPFDTDDQTGAQITITLHVWSKAKGFKETNTILGAIYGRLNRAAFSVTGYSVMDCLFEFSDKMRDGDGVTRHGVARYRLTLQKV